ncbi:hypothetical protein NQ315_005151 [Exocentrus adspersus]|uniref:Uncharacterized protein n=1 Tax=Exocentrus adspersus TaxID=1586481 RepID=A0AAV8VTM8_9CUCU|nr:hypothetical protein NQ315_005151 [Exocentrus adspersus]
MKNYLRRSRHLKSEILKSSSFVDDNEMDNYDEPNLSKITPKEILSFAWQICNENVSEDHPNDISPLNYLSRAQSYEKCGATDKILNNEVENITENDINLLINTQGYETPVKIPRRVKTPTNEEPEEYTDMGGKSK